MRTAAEFHAIFADRLPGIVRSVQAVLVDDRWLLTLNGRDLWFDEREVGPAEVMRAAHHALGLPAIEVKRKGR